MLRQLAIRDVVLVERLDLEFSGGLTVLTGETGAGKSILLDALGLALGRRADSALVRTGAHRAEASAEFELPEDHPACALLDEEEIEREAGEPLILRRSVKADGGSRAWLSGAAVPARMLQGVGEKAVEIHGQHDERGLLDAKGHRGLLDAFGRIETGNALVDPRLVNGTGRGTLRLSDSSLVGDDLRIAFRGLGANLALRGDLEAGRSQFRGPATADRLAPEERCASTSNRNFEGRQGFRGRTHLVSPAMAAAAAIAGRFVDVRKFR